MFLEKITNYLASNFQRVKMSDNSKNSNLGQKVTDAWDQFTKNSHDFEKEIEDMINSAGQETDSMLKRAKDKMAEFYQESKKHSQLVVVGVIVGISAIILGYGVMKIIC